MRAGDPDERPGELRPEEIPDVEVSAGVRARRLRFRVVPKTRVWFEGEPGFRASSESQRENLPDEVEPEVTYRDAIVRWRAAARIDHPTDPSEG